MINSPTIRKDLGIIREDPVVTSVSQGKVFILALQEYVIFPNIRTSINLRQRTFRQLCEHMAQHNTKDIGVITVNPGKREEDDLYRIGTFCKLITHSQPRLDSEDDNGTASIVVHGSSRFKLVNFEQTQPYRTATIELIQPKAEGDNDDVEVQGLMDLVQQSLLEHFKGKDEREIRTRNAACLSELACKKLRDKHWPTSASLLADMVGFGLGQLTTKERQQVLASVPMRKRLEVVLDLLSKIGEAQKVAEEINCNIKTKSQAEVQEAMLRMQLKELQKEMRMLKQQKSSRPRRKQRSKL